MQRKRKYFNLINYWFVFFIFLKKKKIFLKIVTRLNCLIRVGSQVIIFGPSIASSAPNRILAFASDKISAILLFALSMLKFEQFDLQFTFDISSMHTLIMSNDTVPSSLTKTFTGDI